MRIVPSLADFATGVDREIGSQYDTIKYVADNLDAILSAEENAVALVNQMSITGVFDAAPGIAPSTPYQGSAVYRITGDGTINGLDYVVNDHIYYDSSLNLGATSWFKIGSNSSPNLTDGEDFDTKETEGRYRNTFSTAANGPVQVSGILVVEVVGSQIEYIKNQKYICDNGITYNRGKVGGVWETIWRVEVTAMPGLTRIHRLTQSEYNAISSPTDETLYIVVG